LYTESKNYSGYTLVELALCISIVGILMSGFMGGGMKFVDAHKKAETQRRADLAANLLSAYAQTHYRLPCPADPKETVEKAGLENCAVSSGALPWKELAIPQAVAADAWGNYFVYKPSPALTAQNPGAREISAACRSAAWFDADGNELNRAKAAFCCGMPPQPNIGEAGMIIAAAAANEIEPAAGGADFSGGRVSAPHYMEGPAAAVIEIANPAVTLSAGGISLPLRADQLFARAGSGSCAAPQASATRPYACMPQNFRSGGGTPSVKDSDSGQMVDVPPLYGVELALAGDKFQLHGTLTNSSADSDYDSSLGFYVIRVDGRIDDVQMLVPGTKIWPKGATVNFKAETKDIIGIGFFIVPDGFARMDGYKHADLKKLKLLSGVFGKINAPASIAEQVPPLLVSVDPATGSEVTIRGAGGVSAYHLYSNLNQGHAGHILRADSICRFAGEMAGPNRDFRCRRATTLSGAGVDPARPALALIGFEESADINCYESRDGHCHGASHTGKDLIADGAGGYIASIGDNSYDDVAFSVSMTACPQK
jgi:type II secretory pathway pseudopilin PulG